MPIEINFQPNAITTALITAYAARQEAERDVKFEEARLASGSSRGGGGGGSLASGLGSIGKSLAKRFQKEQLDPSGEFDLSTVGGRKAFEVASRKDAASIYDERAIDASERRTEAATIAQKRRVDLAAIKKGAFEASFKPGLTTTQKNEIASLQNAKQQLLSGEASGGSRMPFNRAQTRIAIAEIDSRLGAIQPGFVPLTPDEIAQRNAPTPESVMGSAFKVDGIPIVLDKNGIPKVVVDNTQERTKLLLAAREQVANLEGYDDLTPDDQNRATEEQFLHDWALVTGNPIEHHDDPGSGAGTPGSQLEGPPQIKELPTTAEGKIDQAQLVAGELYQVRSRLTAELMTLMWTGTKFTKNLEAGLEESRPSENGKKNGLKTIVSGGAQ